MPTAHLHGRGVHHRADPGDLRGRSVDDSSDAVHRRRGALDQHLGPVEQRQRTRDGSEERLDLLAPPLEGRHQVTGAGHGQAHGPIPTSGAREAYRAAATDSSVPASFCDSQIGMIDSTMSAAATTLTTGAWLGRNRFW